MKGKKLPSFVDYFTVIIKRRYFILKIFSIVTIAALIISLIIPPQYTATATILPPNLQQDAMMGLVQSNILSGLSGLSGLGRILPGATTPSDLFAAILQSGRIKGKIIQKYDLKKVFKTKTMYDTYRVLQGITKIGVSPEGIIAVSVTWYDKHLAADIANSYIEELDKFNTETTMTTGKRYRIFIEERLKESKDTLMKTEEALRNFRKEHRTISLNVEIKSAIETIAQLKSQIILLEVKKGVLTSSSQMGNPYLYNLNRELRELKKQLSKIEFGGKQKNKKEFGAGFSVPFSELPEVSLEYVRVIRNVKVQEAIFELLTQQYEQAKIMEVKDTPTVQILDKASAPERKSIPKRAQIVILAAFFSLVLGIITSFLLESIGQFKKRPEEYKKWSIIYNKIKHDIIGAKNWISKLRKR